MGFLSMPDPPDALDMATATVSFWFRVPQATIDQVTKLTLPRGGAAGYSEAATWPVLQWTLTFLSWGDQQRGTVWFPSDHIVGHWYGQDGTEGAANHSLWPDLRQTGTMAPSYIGLDMSGRPNANNDTNAVNFVVNLQSDSKASVSGYQYALTTWDVRWIATGGGGMVQKETLVHTDFSEVHELAPLTFGGLAGPNIAADQWHHVLLSWTLKGSENAHGYTGHPPDDASPSANTKSSFKMYFALDDKNYDSKDLPATWLDGGNVNSIVSNDIIVHVAVSGSSDGREELTFSENGMGPASYSATVNALPSKSMYVPGKNDYTDDNPARSEINSVYKIEMAELQIFTGVLLDTSDETNRRAFLAPKKKSADIASTDPSTAGQDTGKLFPVDPNKAEELLGKQPDILLHRTNNWKKGKNTGLLGYTTNPVTGEKTENPSGQFTPTGTIKKYTPDPSITAPSG